MWQIWILVARGSLGLEYAGTGERPTMIALPLLLLLAGAGADGGHDHEDHQKYVGGAPWSTPLGPDPVASDGGLEMLEVRCKEPHPERTQWGHADPELTLAIVAVYDSDLPADEVPTVDDVRAHFWGPRAAAWLDKISAGARAEKIETSLRLATGSIRDA